MKKMIILISLAVISLIAFTSCTPEEVQAFADGYEYGYNNSGYYENSEDENYEDINFDSELIIEEAYNE